MAFRDDHEAALARIEGLERELAGAQTHADRIAELERDLAEARARLDRAEATLAAIAPRPAAAPAPAVTPTAARDPVALRRATSAMIGLAVIVVLVVLARRGDEPPRSPAIAPVGCTVEQVRARALRDGAPPEREPVITRDATQWLVVSEDAGRNVWRQRYPDDCR